MLYQKKTFYRIGSLTGIIAKENLKALIRFEGEEGGATTHSLTTSSIMTLGMT